MKCFLNEKSAGSRHCNLATLEQWAGEVTLAVPPSIATDFGRSGFLRPTCMLAFKKNILLSDMTNYRIGGPADFFFDAKTKEDIAHAIKEAKRQKLQWFVLGSGTNILAPDEGFRGLVLRPGISFIEVSGTTICAGAGTLFPDVVEAAAKAGLSGLEWAGGLPGTFGGAIRGNAGAFGGEIKDSIAQVESFDIKTLEFRSRTNAECAFSYRSSVFKEKGDEIVVSATLTLTKGDSAKIKEAVDEKIAHRAARHPLEYPNVGSIFKNIPLTRIFADNTRNYAEAVRNSEFDLRGVAVRVKADPFPVVAAASLISRADLKGTRIGGAMVSEKHGNFIVNISNAKASDVKALMAVVKKGVAEKFGIDLEEEVCIL